MNSVKKADAILDSSFYIHLVKTNLLSYFLKFYNIVVCSKVKEEILYFKNSNIYLPLDIEIFSELENLKIISIINPLKIDNNINSQISHNSGELYSIALAKEKGIIVFIDNGRPFEYCKKNNILCANIVEFLLFLNKNKILSKKVLFSKINIIKEILPRKYLEDIKNKI
jgi:predicted nucleic acid-binding protein